MRSLNELMRKISAEPNDVAQQAPAVAVDPATSPEEQISQPVTASPDNAVVVADGIVEKDENNDGDTIVSQSQSPVEKPQGIIKRLASRFITWVKRLVGF